MTPTYTPRALCRRLLLCRLRRGRHAFAASRRGPNCHRREPASGQPQSFADVYSLVEQNYAEPINGDKADTAIYDGAIPGMLRVLDPHSNFYDPKAYARLREDQDSATITV